ncbi:hypothetical protein ACLOJK_025980 [Asimina triloba]
MDCSSEAAEASTSTSYNMDSFPEVAVAVLPVSASVPNWMLPTDDQRFLLFFIMGIYFGPDLKYEMHKKSALQRIAEDLPPYTLDQLAGSYMKTVDVERIYYYVLRNADQSVKVKMPLLQNFVQGCLFFPSEGSVVDNWQFPDLFAAHLHPQSRLRNRYKVIKNIVFINNPEISFIKPEDLERFKRLARLEDLSLDRDAAMSLSVRVSRPVIKPEEGPSNKKLPKKTQSKSQHYQRVDDRKEAGASRPSTDFLVEPISAIPSSGLAGKADEGPSNRELPKNSDEKSQNNQLVDDPMQAETPGPSTHTIPEPMSAIPHGKSNSNPLPGIGVGQPVERVGPAKLLLPSYPTVEEWNNVVNAVKGGIAVTGTAAERQIGPVIGLVDIGDNEEAYLFRVSLPGVSRHPVLQYLDLHILLHQLPVPCDILAVVDENVLMHQPNMLYDVLAPLLNTADAFAFPSDHF